MATVDALTASRSPLAKLSSLTTPTLMIQGRRDFLFDVDQALAAYKVLKGPKRLYVGDLGHAPGISPASAPDAAIYWGEAVKWFDRFLKGTANGIDKNVIKLGHDPYDGKTTTTTTLPAVKTASVTLPGSTTMSGSNGKVVRRRPDHRRPAQDVRRHEGASCATRGRRTGSPRRLLAVGTTPITAGGVKLNAAQGTVTINLMNEMLKVPAGKSSRSTLRRRRSHRALRTRSISPRFSRTQRSRSAASRSACRVLKERGLR